MATTDALLFWSVFMIVFLINILAPVIAAGLGDSLEVHDVDDANPTDPPSASDIFTLSVFNILLVPFWTIGMPFYMNLFIMIPLRVLAWILILRLIRGN